MLLTLAPLAGYTDLPYRRIVSRFGPDEVTTEMVSIRALYYGDEKTRRYLLRHEEEVPTRLQIFGDDPEMMAEVIHRDLNGHDEFIGFDLNVGCPAPKIVKSGAGSALLCDLPRLRRMISLAVKASEKPLSVKIRKGFHEDTLGMEAAFIAEEEGATHLTVHGRTRQMYYEGQADWTFIEEVARRVTIPVLGNGDVTSAEDVTRHMASGLLAGVAIGRGAIGNPWIFREIRQGLRGEEVTPPKLSELFSVVFEHLVLSCDYYGEYKGIREMRKHLMGYTKHLPEAARLRRDLNRLESRQEVVDYLEDYLKSYGEGLFT